MTKKKIHFMGLLANVDSSILKVKLDHGFKIEDMSCDEGVNFLSTLEKRSYFDIYKKISLDYSCVDLSRDQFYVINKSFESNVDVNNEKEIGKLHPIVFELGTKFVQGYLIPIIHLMRLFKEGNICLPLMYYYIYIDETPNLIMWQSNSSSLAMKLGPNYTLENSDIPYLQKFIQNTKLPFKKPFLQLAFENFELSYTTHNKALSFLSLMISLEILFNPGKGALKKHNISKNTAVLLGKEEKDSEEIQYKIKELYSKRSDIVHNGKADITEKDILNLRFYVRESIKKIYKIDKNKDELLDILNSCSFGKRPWRNE